MGTRAGLWITLALLLLAPAAAPADDAKDCKLQRIAELEMLPNDNGSVLIPVGLNGQPGALALDTGAFWSVLRKGVVSGLARREAGINLIGSGGGELDRYVELPSIEVGHSSFKHADFFVGPDALTEDARVGGNLGANVLQEYDLEIDSGRRQVSLFLQHRCKEDAIYWAESDAVTIPFDLDNHLITIPVVLDGKPLRALLDTGASGSVLSLKAAKALYGLTPQSEGVRPPRKSRTLDGRGLDLYRYRFKSLDIGGIVFNNPLISLGVDNIERANRRALGDNAPDLILGMHQLRLLHLYIAYGEKIIYASSVQGDYLAEAADGGTPKVVLRPATDPLDVDEAKDLVDSAQAHAQKQEFDAALRDFKLAMDNLPDQAWLYENRGIVQGRRKTYAEAIADFSRAIELEPNGASAYFNRAEAYALNGDDAHALDDLTRALALDPKFENGNLERAELYLRKNDFAAAMPDLDRAVALDAHSVRAYTARCWAHERLQQAQLALADCDAAIELDDSDAQALYLRATLNLNTRQLRAAIRDYGALLKRQPERADALYGRGLARSEDGDASGGSADMAAAVKLQPTVSALFTVTRVEKIAPAAKPPSAP